jgi:CysZ protein
MVSRFLNGSGYLIRGLGALNQPGIRRYVWIPVLINLFLLVVMIRGVQIYATDWSGFENGWLSWLSWLIVPILVLLSLLVFGYFFSAILVAVASPFYGLLAGKVERSQGLVVEDEALWSLVLRTFQREWVKFGYFAPRYLLLLLLSFIPVFNLVMPLVWFWFGSWVMALQYRDYTLDNQGVAFTAARQSLARDRWAAWGFGALVSVLMLVPILNCFVPPAAVIGATLWDLEARRSSAIPG